jgi:hypothetical protein
LQLEPFLNFVMRRPFQPFRVHLCDGRRVTVRHPESVTVYRGGLGFWHLLRSGRLEFVEGAAVTSMRSAGVADVADFPTSSA